jgi:hypothetical protein
MQANSTLPYNGREREMTPRKLNKLPLIFSDLFLYFHLSSAVAKEVEEWWEIVREAAQ